MSPAIARIVPFGIYIAFLVIGSALGALAAGRPGADFDERWLYPLQIGLVAAALAWFWRRYGELRAGAPPAAAIALAVAVGAAVFVAWINLDAGWATLGDAAGFDPRRSDGTLDWTLVVPRVVGAALVVPVMEELFWRSFVMRWIDRSDFLAQDPRHSGSRALLVSSVIFGFEHTLWFAGILAGLAYGWLYMRTANLWAPVIAHAVTNAALAAWVLHRGAWHFW
ncbi:MAG: CAAX prenyl protease-related protein [Burkholderiales bacterium]|nr:CAAX prenyl protease-related protein [Burkholderiales bacterium]